MTDHKPENLAGQTAILKTKDGEEEVTFGPDVQLIWISGEQLHSNEPPLLRPEIKGKLLTEKDYSHIKDAELILKDGRVFRAVFVHPQYFMAHESISSRTRVSYE